MRIGILSKAPDNYSVKRLCEEAKLRGHSTSVIDYTKCYVTVEKKNPIVRFNGEDLSDIDAIIPRIQPSLTKYGTSIVRQFELQDKFSIVSSIAITRARDKLRATQILGMQVGIPKTVFARETADFDDVIEQAGGAPLIIKVARGTHGHGVVLAETKKAAKAVMQAFYVENVSFLVQEFIQESEGADIRAFVVGGKIIASMKRQSTDDDFRSNLHQGAKGEPVKLTKDEKQVVLLSAKTMGLQVCGVDLIQSNRGPLVLEVNASPGFMIEQVTGKNVAGALIEHIENKILRKKRPDRVGV